MDSEALYRLAVEYGRLANTDPPDPPPEFIAWIAERTAAQCALLEAAREIAKGEQ